MTIDSKNLTEETALLIVQFPNTFTSETLIEIYQLLKNTHPEQKDHLSRLVNTIAERDRRLLTKNNCK